MTYTDSAENQATQTELNAPSEQDLLAEYSPYGISFDKKGKMYFNKKLVRYFEDSIEIVNNTTSVLYEYLNEEGIIDVHTTRSTKDNGDGSIDPFGKLTGIKKCNKTEFEQRNLVDIKAKSEAVTYAVEGISGGETFEQKFSKYKDYGIDYKEGKESSIGNVYYKGQLVKQFIDKNPKGGTFTFQSVDGGKIIVHTVYDKKAKLIGIEK